MAKRNRNKNYVPPGKANIPTLIGNPAKTLVSIIIPVYNRFDLLARCLASIPDAFKDISYDIVLVDNASEKASADAFYEMVKARYPLTVIRNSQNMGFPVACNLGAKRTRSPLIFLLNSDVILDPESGVKLVQEMDDPLVGICGMKLVFPPDAQEMGLNPEVRPPGKIQHIGISMNVRAEPHHAFIGWDENHPRVMNMHSVWAVTGAAMMIRRIVWNKSNGLFEGYGLGSYEDLDICQVAYEIGYNVTVVPQARGLHYTGGTAEAMQMAYPLNQNRMIFLNRWNGKLKWWDGMML